MKVILIEIKKKLYRETIVEWMKPRIKSMTWKIRKQKTIRTIKRKKNPKT